VTKCPHIPCGTGWPRGRGDERLAVGLRWRCGGGGGVGAEPQREPLVLPRAKGLGSGWGSAGWSCPPSVGRLLPRRSFGKAGSAGRHCYMSGKNAFEELGQAECRNSRKHLLCYPHSHVWFGSAGVRCVSLGQTNGWLSFTYFIPKF